MLETKLSGKQFGVRAGVDVQQTQLLQPQRVQDLVVPEYVDSRTILRLDNFADQANRFLRLHIELSKHFYASLFFELIQDWLRKLFVQSRIDHDLFVMVTDAAKTNKLRGQGQNC